MLCKGKVLRNVQVGAAGGLGCCLVWLLSHIFRGVLLVLRAQSFSGAAEFKLVFVGPKVR